MKWMILGANGQLGRCAQDFFNAETVVFTALNSTDVDICDSDTLRKAIEQERPDIILNAAAYTAVDKAESDSERAFAVNAEAVKQLAILCKKYSILLVHISTDYVFSGDATCAYRETDVVAPQSVYGASKLRGEQYIGESGCRAIIIRTAWVFSEYGNNFLKTMVRLAQERNELSVVADQIGCPTYAGDIAAMAYRVAQSTTSTTSVKMYHFAGDVAVSWWAFAAEIHRQAYAAGLIDQMPMLAAVPSAAYPTPAKRPVFSVLSSNKAVIKASVAPSDWKRAIGCVIKKMKEL